MHIKSIVRASIFACSIATAPTLVLGFDFSFLNQAPIRYFNDADLKLLSGAVDRALDKAKQGEKIDWSNAQTGTSGSITPIRSFVRDGDECRRLEVVNRSKKATRGSASSEVDFCKVEGSWKILGVAQ